MINRQNPLILRASTVLTVLFLGLLGISLSTVRGLAFSPGPLTGMQKEGVILQGFTSHADFEKACGNCHQPLQATLGAQCLSCHEDTATQMRTGTGIHGQITNAAKCQACHSDHQGRDFDPTLAAIDFFDHSGTRFSLAHHAVSYDKTPISCNACHLGEDYSAVEDASCQDCHAGADQAFMQEHLEGYGGNCLGCHDGADRMRDFAHGITGFDLEGAHAQTTCRACHPGELISEAQAACQSCHAEPEMHRGMFAATCESCHTAQGWSPATLDGQPFDHRADTGFTLDKHRVDYSKQAINCSTCHPGGLQSFDVQTCVNCHAQADQGFMDEHQSQYGSDCMSCHDGVDRMIPFDHAAVFPLDGRHAEIECVACHANRVFAGTPVLCSQCHAEPEVHAGVFGLSCEACHSTTAWSPATLHEHSFPLGHGLERGAPPTACITCHPTSYTEYTCYGCHEHQEEEMVRKHLEEGISRTELPACVTCHLSGQEAEHND